MGRPKRDNISPRKETVQPAYEDEPNQDPTIEGKPGPNASTAQISHTTKALTSPSVDECSEAPCGFARRNRQEGITPPATSAVADGNWLVKVGGRLLRSSAEVATWLAAQCGSSNRGQDQ